jgi:hypothetical protein
MEKKDYEYNLIGDKLKDEILDFIASQNKEASAGETMIEMVVIVAGLITKLLCIFRDEALNPDSNKEEFIDRSMAEISRVVKLMSEASVKSTREEFNAKYKKELN